MMTAARSRKTPMSASQRFSGDAFVRGLGFGAAGFLVLFSYLVFQADNTKETLSARLASRVVPVMRAEKPTAASALPLHSPLEAYSFPPAPAPVQLAETVAVTSAEAQAETPAVTPAKTAEETAGEAAVSPPKAASSVNEHAQDFSGPLEPAPLTGLYQQSEDGFLPRISDAGLTPFMAYKQPFVADSRPVVIIALQDFGLSETLSTRALEVLPVQVSLVISPYVPDAETWQKRARQKGHEVWLSVPFENKNSGYEDLGPYGLVTNASLSENQKKLNWLMSRITGYAGLAGYTDDVMNSNNSMTISIVKSFYARGIAYLELNTLGAPTFETLAVAANTPFINSNETVPVISRTVLSSLQKEARAKGYAVLTLPLTQRNLSELGPWLEKLSSEGLRIGPVSAVPAIKQFRQNSLASVPASQGP